MATDIPVYDVIIIGAGLSGIGAAYHLQSKSPNRTYTILEGRANMGGTWDLFKYPGIRSDSDMFTLGFSFNPWTSSHSLATGPQILQYIKDTAAKFGIDKHIQYNHRVTSASWSDADKLWTLQIAAHPDVPEQTLQCRFFFSCSGYYNYEEGYTPNFPKSEQYQGLLVHPQNWDTSTNYDDKTVIIIGSGATAVTMVPEMAKRAKKVIMLQRSPTYILSLPEEDPIAKFFSKVLPPKLAYSATRWKNILMSLFIYKYSRSKPERMRNFILGNAKKQLPEGYDLKHFNPKYDPWDQRLCVVPDGDLFSAIKAGKVDVVTDTIKEFTPTGILLDSGKQLDADIVVTATGLNLKLMGGIELRLNGEKVDYSNRHVYKGVMISGIPNFAFAVGYTNASWTLKCDLNCHFVTRVLNHMEQHGYDTCTPQFDPKEFNTERLLDFDAGYVLRSEHLLPKQGDKHPWKVYQNYLKDSKSLKRETVDDRWLAYQ